MDIHSGVLRRFLPAVMVLGIASPAVQLHAADIPGGGPAWAGSQEKKVLFQTGFEQGQPTGELDGLQPTTRRARTGKRAVFGQVDKPQSGCFLRVPFTSSRGRMLHVSFWMVGDRGTVATMFVHSGPGRKDRKRIGTKYEVSASKWRRVEASFRLEGGSRGVLEVVAPTSWSGKPGRVWIDDLVLAESADVTGWPACVEDFPALACDKAGALWMALLDRPVPRRRISVYRLAGGKRTPVCSIEPPGLTGLAPPTIAPLDSGCVVAFPVEQGGRWRIAATFVDGRTRRASPLKFIPCEGSVNISPAVAGLGDGAWVVWESNAGESRGIYACRVDPGGPGEVRRLSSAAAHANSYNPAIVALEDGSLFAAWDSFRDKGADIYGAWRRKGRWLGEQRITAGARIERHPSLAARGGSVWMAWQAQSFEAMKLNAPGEQRVAVARIDAGRLSAPAGLFQKVSPPGAKLLRPRICFDGEGRLRLVVRKSGGQHEGWYPLAWCYSGRQWSGPHLLGYQQGRWRPVNLARTPHGVGAAVQYDDRGPQQGIFPDWHSGVAVLGLPVAAGDPAPPATEPLKMPETDFSVEQKMDQVATMLPRQSWTRPAGQLKLYWGDFHDHTDLSICGRSVNPPGHDLFANVRDLERLDFAALTDHGYNLDRPQWAYNGEQTRNNHDPGRFLAFLGQEWTSKRNPPAGGKVTPKTPYRYGHRNLIYVDPYYPKFHDAMDGNITPRDLWDKLKGVDFVTIPHQLADWKGKGRGNPPTDWSYTDELLQPVAEIHQARQSYEYLGCPRQAPQGAPFRGYYMHDAWARGIIIGVVASPDHGGGNGKVAVWTKDLTRKAVLDAIRARHCYGTSGAKMSLWFGAGDAMMGDKVRRTGGSITFRVRALAMRDIRELVIFRNNKVVHRANPRKKEFRIEWTDRTPPDEKMLWYYARIQAVDQELAWSSPIWFLK